ncbi:hypothetical protein [Bradyrhizobium jicamae]|uniref:hypothetical protein n=1 Tax=Bradyrhizobium jicamae TaxID=280332 RepID=UPI001BAA9C91|nr:hypothetical protein [Bradyrhizobium jicamae]MBR0938514.1 hypothetical protein [Bradyrhizobium jicamae]
MFDGHLKNPALPNGGPIFREKLKLQWALKKCIKDPMNKAVIERLDKDPIVLKEG